MNTGNEKVTALDITPYYWTPFHQYMENTLGCKDCPVVHKWEPYFKAYHTHLARFRGKEVTMMEVGVQSGGSMMMWRSYFGSGLRYYGLDINPQAQKFSSDWATIFIGDQADPAFWESIRDKVPDLDFFLDDGGHTQVQQITTFRNMYNKVKLGGIYACEDLATSYSTKFGGHPLPPGSLSGPTGSMIELAKQMIDWMNCYYVTGDFFARSRKCPPELDAIPEATGIKETAYSLSFYSQIMLIEKARVVPPRAYMAGGYSFPYVSDKPWDGHIYKAPARATAPR